MSEEPLPTFAEMLPVAAAELLSLAEEHLARPIAGLGPGAVAIGLGRHAEELCRGVLRECDAGALAPAAVVLRALVDAAILLRWLEQDPAWHMKRWSAEDDRHRLLAAKAAVELRRRRGRPPGDPPFSVEETRVMKEHIADVQRRLDEETEGRWPRPSGQRKRAQDVRLVPPIDQMRDPKDNALWESYEIVYRLLSSHVHASLGAMDGHALEERPDGLHIIPGQLWKPDELRGLAVPAFALALASVSRQAGLGIEETCDRLRNAVALWPSDEQ
jgi:hypothetical protein